MPIKTSLLPDLAFTNTEAGDAVLSLFFGFDIVTADDVTEFSKDERAAFDRLIELGYATETHPHEYTLTKKCLPDLRAYNLSCNLAFASTPAGSSLMANIDVLRPEDLAKFGQEEAGIFTHLLECAYVAKNDAGGYKLTDKFMNDYREYSHSCSLPPLKALKSLLG